MNTLRVGRLVLEPQLAAHAAEMFEVLSDPAIYEFENSPPESRRSLEQRFSCLESRLSPNGDEQWLNWVIRLPTGALAGYVQATIGLDRVAHIAYEVASTNWRRGVGRTAVSAMLGELSATYDVHTFAATLKPRNYRSMALLRKLGFRLRAPYALHQDSEAADEVVMYKDNEPLPVIV
jgi:[ribosomal protein S5]-alanine N-acetyltransferase